ncbi:MAG: tyrosine-protein phosphatase [Acidobacteria bacterium]|nr:tyrosine-protein phosphatase [Acidobacteriota bacterium]
MQRFRKLTWVTVLPLFLVFAVLALRTGRGTTSSSDDLPRFHTVTKDLYRGGQPSQVGFHLLKEKGVKTVINFRPEGDQEKDVVKKLGMKYVHIPLNSRRLVADDDSIQTFLRILTDPGNYPIFVHCRRGADRTGLMVGMYRIAFQGWDGRQAYKEARKIGMRWWYQGFKHQLYRFAEERQQLNEFRSSSVPGGSQ